METPWPSNEDYMGNEGKQRKRRKPKPKPFPMSKQMLASITSSDVPSSSKSPFVSPRLGKRTSEDESEYQGVSKKFRMECIGYDNVSACSFLEGENVWLF
jgi:hypothetical protein